MALRPRITRSSLAFMRQTAKELMTDSCVIERLVGTRGEYGDATETWQGVQNTCCRVIQAGQSNAAQRVEVGTQDHLREVWRLVLPWDVALGVGYRVRVVGMGESERIYRVVGVQDNLTDAVDTQALVERWQG